jgi:hypothetical protein
VGIEERFIGAWRLVSMESRSTAGSLRYPLGREPSGLIVWDRSGTFSVQIAPSDESSSYVAYFGSWSLDEDAGEIALTVAETINAALRGTVQRRKFAFEDDRLTLQPPPTESDGETVTTHVLWQRLG